MGWSYSGHRQHLLHLATPVTRPDSVWFLPVEFRQGQCLRPTTPKDTTRIVEGTSTPQSGTSHKKCLRRFGGNGSIAWTSSVSHVGRTSNAFKVTMELQTFLFQMVVTSCIYVQYLWKYGFAKFSDNLYALCIYIYIYVCVCVCVYIYKWLSGIAFLYIFSRIFWGKAFKIRACEIPNRTNEVMTEWLWSNDFGIPNNQFSCISNSNWNITNYVSDIQIHYCACRW